MNKASFMKSLTRARLKFEAALELVGDDDYETPGASGEMSVKDLIAHVAWYEREMVDLLAARTLAGSPLWGKPPAERNTAILEMNRDRGLEEIVEEAGEIYDRLVDLLAGLEEEALSDPAFFKDMPPDWIPWEIIAGNATDHYRDHAEDVLTWLAP